MGILVSSCARNPPSVVPVAYGSASGTPHRSAKHHHVALAQAPLRHPKAASEGHRRRLSPWNYSAPANAATPHTDHLPAAPETPAPANATTPPYGSPPDRPPCLGIPSYLRDRATRLLALARVTRRARSRTAQVSAAAVLRIGIVDRPGRREAAGGHPLGRASRYEREQLTAAHLAANHGRAGADVASPRRVSL